LRSKREENTFLFFKKYEKESCKKAINYFESDLLKAQNRDDNGKKIMEARKKSVYILLIRSLYLDTWYTVIDSCSKKAFLR